MHLQSAVIRYWGQRLSVLENAGMYVNIYIVFLLSHESSSDVFLCGVTGWIVPGQHRKSYLFSAAMWIWTIQGTWWSVQTPNGDGCTDGSYGCNAPLDCEVECCWHIICNIFSFSPFLCCAYINFSLFEFLLVFEFGSNDEPYWIEVLPEKCLRRLVRHEVAMKVKSAISWGLHTSDQNWSWQYLWWLSFVADLTNVVISRPTIVQTFEFWVF